MLTQAEEMVALRGRPRGPRRSSLVGTIARIRGDDIRTFHGLYAAVYRRSSALIHPTQEGMERHMESTDTGLIISLDELQAQPRARAPVGFAVAMMAFMLVVYATISTRPGSAL